MPAGIGRTGTAPGAGRPDAAVAAVLLEVGEQVSATVLELLEGGRVMVGLRGIKVEARTEVPLEAGATYRFTVAEAGERVRLAIGDPPGAAGPHGPVAGLLASLLARGGGPELHLHLAALRQLLEGPPGPLAKLLAALQEWPGTAELLQRLVQGLGLNHEASLLEAADKAQPPPPAIGAGLKALLLDLHRQPPPSREIGRAVEATLDALEGLQAENLHQAREGGGLMIPLPVVSGLRFGELRFFPPRQGEGEEASRAGGGRQPFRVVCLIDLERLGPVRVDLEAMGAELRLLFQARRQDAVDWIRTGLPALGAELAARGLRVVRLEARPFRPAGSVREAAGPAPRLEGGRLVDVEG